MCVYLCVLDDGAVRDVAVYMCVHVYFYGRVYYRGRVCVLFVWMSVGGGCCEESSRGAGLCAVIAVVVCRYFT